MTDEESETSESTADLLRENLDLIADVQARLANLLVEVYGPTSERPIAEPDNVFAYSREIYVLSACKNCEGIIMRAARCRGYGRPKPIPGRKWLHADGYRACPKRGKES